MTQEITAVDHLILAQAKFTALIQQADFMRNIMLYLLNDKGQNEVVLNRSGFNNLPGFTHTEDAEKIVFTKVGYVAPAAANDDKKISTQKKKKK